MQVRWTNLGRAPYEPVLRFQQRLLEGVACGADAPRLLLVEHDPPVITLGRSAREEDILADTRQLARLGAQLDEQRNVDTVGKAGPITADGCGLPVWIVPTDEEMIIARDTASLVC